MDAVPEPVAQAIGFPGPGACGGIAAFVMGIIPGTFSGFSAGGISAIISTVSAALRGGIRPDLGSPCFHPS